MSGPREDTGSRTPEDAERFERWRARTYDPPDDDAGMDEYEPRARGRGCRCHSRSEEPYEYCSGPGPDAYGRES